MNVLRLFLAGVVLALGARADDWRFQVEVGAGRWEGDATYSIGGKYRDSSGTYRLPDKISELEFPLGVSFVSLGGSVSWKERVELRATFMANVNDPSAKSKDSDWDDDGQLIAYSESDSALDARAVDASLLYTLIQKTTAGGSAWALRGGAGLAYQTFDWKDGKTWQVDEGGLSFFEGALTYKSDVTMPCAMVAGSYHSGSVGIRLEAGAGPVFVRDEDDHVLREIRAEADMTGTGFRGLAEIRWDATKRIYLLARASTLTARVDGTSKNLVYGPGVDGENDGLIGDTWKIDEKYSINSTTYSLVVGLNF